ncbi:hypothetical protein [Salimicrobium jeotgali]|uniref:hypothetical protein n=1 Tax=Salimicrobium jeotgali TaxID=1230341 RepID=UPI000C8554EC|nr:hypothetical protein [Salimicrobium jeotgali]
MKKIFVLTNSINGLYNFRREVIIELLNEGYDVFIVAPHSEKVSYFNEIGCDFIEVSISRRGKNLITDLKLLLKYIKFSLLRKIGD